MSYEYFLYLFPLKKFYKKLGEIEDRLGLTLWEVVDHELYCLGLVGKPSQELLLSSLQKSLPNSLQGFSQIVGLSNFALKTQDQ